MTVGEIAGGVVLVGAMLIATIELFKIPGVDMRRDNPSPEPPKPMARIHRATLRPD
jgi:hypothetical protein